MSQRMETQASTNGHNGNGAVRPEARTGAYGSEMQAARQMAEEFFIEGMDAYNEAVIGEDQAKIMYLSLLTMGGENGMAGLVIGAPGGGKSLLLENAHKLVYGIGENEVASVPHREDLTPAKLVGDKSEMEREGVDENGDAYKEKFSSKVLPILHPGIKVVKFDEITRTSPLALNAALKIMQDGKIRVSHKGENAEVSELDLIVSSMNNFGTMFTHNLDPAIVSRHAMGAFMGEREVGGLSDAGNEIFDNPHKQYTNNAAVEPVITREDLGTIRSAINHVEIHDTERERGKELVANMLDALKDNGINMADGRTAAQVLKVARTLSMFRARKAVDEVDLTDAVGYGMTSRLGAAGGKSQAEINGIVGEVIS